MKKILSIILSAILVVSMAGSAFANEGNVTIQKQSIGDYQVELHTPDPLNEGEKDIDVKITKDGEPVQGLTVKVSAEMDKSDSSMSMDMDEAKAQEKDLQEDNPGEYMTQINFEGAGNWKVTVMLGDMQKATFDVLVEKSGPNWVIVGGFIGVIVFVILIAAVLRRKNSSEQGGM